MEKSSGFIDGKFWTAGGAFAATDMFAHWVMENYGRDVGEGRICQHLTLHLAMRMDLALLQFSQSSN
jgi:transcriptional regulator GlxA family with amidase domain